MQRSYFWICINRIFHLLLSYTLIVMARHPVMKMILNDFDSDDELEMVTICAIEMNKLNSEESFDVRRGSI